MSMASAGPSGTQAMAEGEFGSGSSTNFQQENNNWENSWGFQSDGRGNISKHSKKTKKKQSVHA